MQKISQKERADFPESDFKNSEAPSSGGGTSSNQYIRGRVFRGSRKQVKRKYSLFKLAV